METRLVGVHKVNVRKADGTTVTYFYAWRGGPRIRALPGTMAFTQEFVRLTRNRPTKDKPRTIGSLLGEFRASADFARLRPSTRRDYERIIGAIRARFGTMPLEALEARGARKVFVNWRDDMRATPRSADLHISVLARVFSWAKDLEEIGRNPLERIGKLHSGSRKDVIWMPGQVKTMMENGAPQIARVVGLALWTMQRQADLLTMPTLAYSDGLLWITQAKTGARVRIRPPADIVPMLEEAKAQKRQRILVNSHGGNWTSSGFRASLRREMKRLGISGVTFHDLRGTGITYAYAAGVEIERIAEISGHSKSECETIIRKNYLAGDDVIEAIRSGTFGQ